MRAAPANTCNNALRSPSWAPEMTSCTPLSPRRDRLRQNSSQKALGLAGADREPEHALLAGVAHTHGHHRRLADDPSALSHLLVRGVESHTPVRLIEGRSRNSASFSSSRAQIRLTSLRLMLQPSNAAMRSSTLRVLMPST